LGTQETTPVRTDNQAPTSALPRIWDTRDVEPRQALAYYHDSMCVAFSPVVPRIAADQRARFSARVESRAAGIGFVNRVEAVTHRLGRRGCCSVTQNGVEVTTRAGDVVLLSGSDPFELVHAREPRFAVTTLLMNGQTFRQRLGYAEPAHPVVVSNHPTFGALIREAVRLFARSSAQLSPEAAATLFDSTVQVARLACVPRSAAKASLESRSGVLFQLLSDHIERNFRNPQLGAAEIAAVHSISARYVHKLFEQHGSGQTLTEYVIDCRIAWAARRLADPQARHATVTDTAYDAGFSDLTHFYRAFRRRYGAAPGKFRAAPPPREPSAD
jgi:AraC-like DNA-binding protein